MDAIASRTTSALPVSIGTSLALESIFEGRNPPYDPNRPIPQRVDITQYDQMWFNLSTIFRNLIGALPRDMANQAPDVLAEGMRQDIDVITSVIKEQTQGHCVPVFYMNSYDGLLKSPTLDKSVQFRLPKTDNQKLYAHSEKLTLELLKKENSIPIHHTKEYLKPENNRSRSIILTHMPFDLLSHQYFGKLDLIESHTGVLKSRKDWHTKYYGMQDDRMALLPFIRQLLMIFGDSHLIHPMFPKIRKMILDIAEHRNWTPLTTAYKVYEDLNRDIKERYVIEVYRRLD